MSLYLSSISKKSFIINLLFSSLVFSFIAGNLIININVLLIIVISIFFYKKKIMDINLDLIDKTIIAFFIYIVLSGLFKNVYYLTEVSSKDFTSTFPKLILDLLRFCLIVLEKFIRSLIQLEIISLHNNLMDM